MAKEFDLRSVTAVWKKMPGHDHALHEGLVAAKFRFNILGSCNRDMSFGHFPSRTVSSC